MFQCVLFCAFSDSAVFSMRLHALLLLLLLPWATAPAPARVEGHGPVRAPAPAPPRVEGHGTGRAPATASPSVAGQGTGRAPAPAPLRVEGLGAGRAPRNLATFLTEINLENYLDLFVREEITIELLPLITEAQFERIGVRTLGQRMRLVQSAQSISPEEEEDHINNEANREIEEPERNHENEPAEVENTLDETRRGEEEPDFFIETSVKGDKKYHKF